MFSRLKAWLKGIDVIELPADYKFIIVSAGDKDHPVTMQQINNYRGYVQDCIDEKCLVVGLPYWVKLTVMK